MRVVSTSFYGRPTYRLISHISTRRALLQIGNQALQLRAPRYTYVLTIAVESGVIEISYHNEGMAMSAYENHHLPVRSRVHGTSAPAAPRIRNLDRRSSVYLSLDPSHPIQQRSSSYHDCNPLSTAVCNRIASNDKRPWSFIQFQVNWEVLSRYSKDPETSRTHSSSMTLRIPHLLYMPTTCPSHGEQMPHLMSAILVWDVRLCSPSVPPRSVLGNRI
jgi:hypothetical protein